MTTQIKIGEEYENKLAKWLQERRFWAYNLPRKTSGQPCDIIAIRGSLAILIDVKHVRREEVSFPFSRIEPNQISALAYAKNFACITNTGFAIFFERNGVWYWFPYDTFVYSYTLGEKSVNKENLITLEEFVNENLNK